MHFCVSIIFFCSFSPTPTPHSIAPGATATLTYTITPSTALSGSLGVATVTYTPEKGGKKIEATSTDLQIYVITPLQRVLGAALKAGAYVTLGAVTTPAQWRNVGVVALIAGIVFGGKAATRTVGDARKRRAYRKALEEVEKMK